MGRPATVREEDRKVSYPVSMSARQREEFKRRGGSRWLQAMLEIPEGLHFPTTELKVKALAALEFGERPLSVTLQDAHTGAIYGPYHVGDKFLVDLRAPRGAVVSQMSRAELKEAEVRFHQRIRDANEEVIATIRRKK